MCGKCLDNVISGKALKKKHNKKKLSNFPFTKEEIHVVYFFGGKMCWVCGKKIKLQAISTYLPHC